MTLGQLRRSQQPFGVPASGSRKRASFHHHHHHHVQQHPLGGTSAPRERIQERERTATAVMRVQGCFSTADVSSKVTVLLADIRMLIVAIRCAATTSPPSAAAAAAATTTTSTTATAGVLSSSSMSMSGGAVGENGFPSTPQEPAELTRRRSSGALAPEERCKFTLPVGVATVLGYLFQPDHHPKVDALRSYFQLSAEPWPKPCFGLEGFARSLALVAPHVHGEALYRVSPVVTALRSVSMVAILLALQSLCDSDSAKTLCMECILFYTQQQPQILIGYQFPSFLWCVQWLSDVLDDVRTAARMVMGAAVSVMSVAEFDTLHQRLLEETRKNLQQVRSPTLAIALCLLCVQEKSRVKEESLSVAANALLNILHNGGSMHSVAIALLGEHLLLWQPFVGDVLGTIRKLFDIALPDLRGDTGDHRASPAPVRPTTPTSP
eukprot:RCo042525